MPVRPGHVRVGATCAIGERGKVVCAPEEAQRGRVGVCVLCLPCVLVSWRVGEMEAQVCREVARCVRDVMCVTDVCTSKDRPDFFLDPRHLVTQPYSHVRVVLMAVVVVRQANFQLI